MEKW